VRSCRNKLSISIQRGVDKKTANVLIRKDHSSNDALVNKSDPFGLSILSGLHKKPNFIEESFFFKQTYLDGNPPQYR
jgi:hypothetical protein